jgi:hypothetical protein
MDFHSSSGKLAHGDGAMLLPVRESGAAEKADLVNEMELVQELRDKRIVLQSATKLR